VKLGRLDIAAPKLYLTGIMVLGLCIGFPSLRYHETAGAVIGFLLWLAAVVGLVILRRQSSRGRHN
jgi:hypothetical protein